ncbi:MAG: hypothetical protein R3C05_22905 [Pirellulaceae bacterium]
MVPFRLRRLQRIVLWVGATIIVTPEFPLAQAFEPNNNFVQQAIQADTPPVPVKPATVLIQAAADEERESGSSPRADRESRANASGQSDSGKSLAGESIFGEGRVPRVEGNRLVLPALTVPTTELSQIGNGEVPKDNARLAMNEVMPLPEQSFDRGGYWNQSIYQWQAPNTFSHPLYFQDVMLERHGHECEHCFQPAISAARFFGTLPALPYLMTVQRPCELNYTLGYYRPGTRAPNLLQRPPYQRDAVINEAAWVTGAFFLFP